jgi:hypothetical protein
LDFCGAVRDGEFLFFRDGCSPRQERFHRTSEALKAAEEVLVEIETRWPAGGRERWGFFQSFWITTLVNFNDSDLDVLRKRSPEWEFRLKPSADDDFKEAFRRIGKKADYDRGFNDALENLGKMERESLYRKLHFGFMDEIPDTTNSYCEFYSMSEREKADVLRRMYGVEKDVENDK